MWKSDIFSNVIELLLSRQLGKAAGQLEFYFIGRPTHPYTEAFRTLASDYRLLSDYWLSGCDDASRQQLFDGLLHRFYRLAARLNLWECNQRSAFRLTLSRQTAQHVSDWSADAVRTALENYVSDMALLSLEPDPRRTQKMSELGVAHRQYMSDLFNHIWTSEMWQTADADAYTSILLSPTVDAVDQQLLVSAITLAALNQFDIHKFRTLTQVYRHTSDEHLRQRALVGWVVAADAPMGSLYDELGRHVAELCADPHCCEELAEMQMQLVYCLDVDADSRRIRNEIMPDLLNHSNLKITSTGIEEQEEDTLEEILHPDAAERNMEKMEESMKKMVDMQQKGSDIYFSGFSQMKRFPFFSDIANWFVPFYPEHPGISQIWNKSRSSKMLHVITEIGAFCDSDKYSFVLAYEQVLGHLPKSMLELIESGEAVPMPVGGEINAEQQRQPAFIRRIYLQNLYRFFKLFPMRSEFRSPFGDETSADYLFFANPLFAATPLRQHYVPLASFLMKRKMYNDVLSVLQCCNDEYHDFKYYMLMATLVQRNPSAFDPSVSLTDLFTKACELQPDSERALSGLARALFADKRFADARDHFVRLARLRPDNISYELGNAVSLLNMGESGEALQILYRLSYDHPDHPSVRSALAWALTLNAKYEQALKIFEQLAATPDPQPDDLLNYGYCLWLQHRNQEAVAVFRRLKELTTDFNFSDEFAHAGAQLLAAHDIPPVETCLMLDQLQ